MTAHAMPVPEPTGWQPGPDEVLVGVDIIELVSSSMYIDPLTAYREYVQNSADAIDAAREAGLLPRDAHGRIDITVDSSARRVLIRDNGVGLPASEFTSRLTAFGASEKRGKHRRGFRGVGRLAAVGYCQELFFRSRTSSSGPVCELRWDCRLLRTILRAADFHGTLSEVVHRATSHRRYHSSAYPAPFFEVELRGVVRHGRDDLLNESAVRSYLGQVAPVPFAPSFRSGEEIEEFLRDIPTPANLHIFVNGIGPVCRPHSDFIPMKPGLVSKVSEVSRLTIPGVDGGIAAKGWILHHDYFGALPRHLGIRGLRLRSGSLQVGDESVLEATFPEPRFNIWSVGEFHILDRRIIPNGRRDQCETGAHYANVLNHIASTARDIGSRCRLQSQYRQTFRRAQVLAEQVGGGLSILEQGVLTRAARRALAADLGEALGRLTKIGAGQSLAPSDRVRVRRRYNALRHRLVQAFEANHKAAGLQQLRPGKRRVYEEVFSLIYDCASDVRGAKELVDRVIARVRPELGDG